MKIFSKLLSSSTILVVALATSLTFGGTASAACFNYDPTGPSTTSQTPVFNNFCNAPYGVGSEADFVRIRQSTNGDDKDNANNPVYTNSVAASCNSGDKFDIWNYLHNDASPDFNNNGTGTAVAHNVQMALNAPVGTTNSNFTFSAKVTADNAASVSDTATLSCNGKQVKLALVPTTVHVYSKAIGGWRDLADNSVNSTTKLGSPNFGSGDMWGCWDYRTVVVYEVTVQEIPQPKPVIATCDLFQVETGDNRTVRVSQFKYTATNAAYKSTVVNWDSGNTAAPSVSAPITDASKVVGQTHQYNADGTYVLTATVSFSSADNNNIVADTKKCEQQITFKAQTPPVVTTTVTTPSTPPPATPVAPVVAAVPAAATLVNTGPGSIAAMFAVTAVLGSVAYRWFLARRLV